MFYTVRVTGKATSAALFRWLMNKPTTKICGIDEAENCVYVLVGSKEPPPTPLVPVYKKLQVVGSHTEKKFT